MRSSAAVAPVHRITVACLLLSGCTGDAGPGSDASSSGGSTSGGSTSDTPTDTGTPGTSEAESSTTATPADTTGEATSAPASTETSASDETGETGDTSTTGDTATTGGADEPVTQVCMDFCVKYFECFPDNEDFPTEAACTGDCSSTWMEQIGAAADAGACEAAILAFQACATTKLCDGSPQDCPDEFMAYQTACQ